MPVRKMSRTRPAQKRPQTKEEREALKARQKRKEKNIREQRAAAATRVSYVKKPLSQRSIIGMVLAAVALILGVVCIYGGYATQGQLPFSVGGFAMCSILCDLVGFWYELAAFREKEKNYILARIGIVVTGVIMAAWAAIIIIGLKG